VKFCFAWTVLIGREVLVVHMALEKLYREGIQRMEATKA
jgi:hypothetical protein